MSWCSADILGGDTPLDAIYELERAVGWNSRRDGSINQAENAEAAHRKLTTKTGREKVARLVRRMGNNKRDLEDGGLLAVVHVLMGHHITLTPEIERFARAAAEADEWHNEEKRDGFARARTIVIEDFLARLDVAMGKAPATTKKFRVYRKRTIELEGVFEVDAISEKHARDLSAVVAENATVDENMKNRFSGTPNVWRPYRPAHETVREVVEYKR